MSSRDRRPRITLALALTSLAACAEASAHGVTEEPVPADVLSSEVPVAEVPVAEVPVAEVSVAEVVLPEPDFDLPELPYDKAQLSEVLAMDEMIKDSQRLAAAVEVFDGRYQQLKSASETSFNGTIQQQIKGVLAVVDGFVEFQASGLPLGEKAAARFLAEYSGDDDFSTRFRETYSRAEEQLSKVITDNVKRRETNAAMSNTYRYNTGSNVDFLVDRIEESRDLREAAVQRVLSSVRTDLMVADYKKGKDLTDLLLSTRSKLRLMQELAPEHEGVREALATVATKEEARQEEIAAARAAYRFPKRFAGANAPADPAELEDKMRAYLEKSGYDVLAITLASEWIGIHSVLGIHLYNQVDFVVAVPAKGEAGLLDVLYVTGKTGQPELPAPFRTYSVGTIGEMLAKNL